MTWDLAGCLRQVGPGWAGLVTRCWGACRDDGSIVEIFAIKEKFGGLRFYVGSASEMTYAIIEAAEEESYTICEMCGEPGKPREGGWIKTLCEKHYEERGR